MISSFNRILKAGTINVDKDNKIVIDVPQGLGYVEPEVAEGPDAESVAQKSAERIVAQAKAQAEDILRKARASAQSEQEAILARANADAEKLRSDATASGYKTGMDQAKREGDKIRADAEQVLHDAQAARKALEDSLEPEIVDIIIRSLQKLLSDAFAVNPAVVVNLVRQGLGMASGSGDITVHISPDDYEHVIAQRDSLLALTDGSSKLEIIKDHSLKPTDCIIESSFGDIDCSLDQQFDSLKSNLIYISKGK